MTSISLANTGQFLEVFSGVELYISKSLKVNCSTQFSLFPRGSFFISSRIMTAKHCFVLLKVKLQIKIRFKRFH